MARIKYKLEIGYAGCDEEDEIEVDDDMTDEEIQSMIDEMAQEWASSWEGDTRLGWNDEMTEEEYEQECEFFYENVCGYWEYV